MRHRIKKIKANKPRDQRRALVSSQLRSLIINERIITTHTRARLLKGFAERLITYSKEDTVANRRLAYRYLKDRELVKKLFSEIGPRFKERNGGYTRILKVARRPGDNALKSIIEFVERKPE